MRQLFTLLSFSAILAAVNGQATDNRWAPGLIAGKTEYQGDLVTEDVDDIFGLLQ